MIAYAGTVLFAALLSAAGVVGARRNRRVRPVVAGILAGAIAADAVSFILAKVAAGSFRPSADLPLSLCDAAALVSAWAVLSPSPWKVEVTYFWGLAGTLQALFTPDLASPFPSLVFFQYIVGHVAVVAAAFYLIISLKLRPRRGAPYRVLAISAAYSIFVGAVDWLTGANYMFLRHPPGNPTLLDLLGPWPAYIFVAVPVALLLFGLLDLPFDRRPLAIRPRHRDVAMASGEPGRSTPGKQTRTTPPAGPPPAG